VSVNFATADGTATVVDKDYVSRKGMLTFAPGQTAKTITVLVNGNPVVEPDETFFVKLSGARYASIANATGVGTIQNNTPTAVDDYYTTDQVTPVSGNVLANDIGPTGDTLTVSTVNGTAANVSTQITLASGALLTVLADGIYVYDPNGAFNYLAPGQAASDSFTYTAADSAGVQSNTATVTITVYSPIPVQPPGDTGFTPDNPYYPNC
jgi:VCBS repeat-containing protein